MLQRVMSPFSVEIFCLTVPKNFVGEPFCAVFQKISGSQKFMDKRGGGGVSRFSVEKLLSHSAEKCRGHPFNVSENLGYRKILCIIGGITSFRRNLFCFTVPKNFVGQPFRVSLISGIEKIYASEGYVTIFCRNFLSHSAEKFRRATLQDVTNFGYRKFFMLQRVMSPFSVEIFCLTVPKNFVGKPFSASLISVTEKVWIRGEGGGKYHNFSSKFLSHCTEIFHWRTLWCFRKIPLSKIFMHRRGGASRFCRIFLSHRTETKSFVKEPFCFREIFWYRKKFMDKRGHITIFS